MDARPLLLRSARVVSGAARGAADAPRAPEPVDVLLDGDRIAAIAPRLEARGADVVDLGGRVLMPGLWDSHVHFPQVVIQRRRLDLTGTASAHDVLERVRRALVASPPHSTASVLVGYGFRDATWRDAPTRVGLDTVAGDAGVVLVSGDLHCGWVGSVVARRFGVEVGDDGLLREGPWFALLAELERLETPTPADFRATADTVAARGVVGIVDYENADNLGLWPGRVAAGVDALRVEASIWPNRLEAAIAAGVRTGDALDDRGLVRAGRLKIIADGSLNTRTAHLWHPYSGADAAHADAHGAPSVPIEEVRRLVQRAWAHGIAPAVHAIGDRTNSEVLDVFASLGIAGRIEHAQLVRAEDLARFGALGVEASVQPEHAMDDRDLADDLWAGHEVAFPLASLASAGAPLLLGSDAPVAPLDPFVAMAAAVFRMRDGRPPWHPEERIDAAAALRASTRSRVEVGQVADLAIVDIDPLTASNDELREMPVAGTLLGGRWTHRARWLA